MTQSDHFRLLTQRPHQAVDGIVVAVDDGLPLPDAAWYVSTRAQAQALYDAEQNPPPPPPPPLVVSMAALRLALGRDICLQISAWISQIADTNEKFQAQTWWEFAPTVKRSHPVVEQFRVALGKTTSEVDFWFTKASEIDNM